MEHGTNANYQAGCRCSDCRYAHAAYGREYRKQERRWIALGKEVERIVRQAGRNV